MMNTTYSPLNFEPYIKVSKAKSHKVPIFVSAGEKDNTQKLDEIKRTFGAVEKSGYKTTRLETHPGGHSPSAEHMAQALEWFEKGANP
jgi:predicted esterase